MNAPDPIHQAAEVIGGLRRPGDITFKASLPALRRVSRTGLLGRVELGQTHMSVVGERVYINTVMHQQGRAFGVSLVFDLEGVLLNAVALVPEETRPARRAA